MRQRLSVTPAHCGGRRRRKKRGRGRERVREREREVGSHTHLVLFKNASLSQVINIRKVYSFQDLSIELFCGLN